jgi:competence protein ComEA
MLYHLWERYRRIVIAAGLLLFVLLSMMLYPGQAEQLPSLPLESPAYAVEQEQKTDTHTASSPAGEQPAGNQQMYVDVKGSVKQPGVYPFSKNERVQSAVAKAGGFLPNADVDRINLAQPLTDGMVVWVPAKGEKQAGNAVPVSCPCSPAPPASSNNSTTGVSASRTAVPTGEDKVNINTATLQQLMTLPGIGETRAQAILAYREKHGSFRTPEQLKQVGGIGDKMFERLKNHIVAE